MSQKSSLLTSATRPHIAAHGTSLIQSDPKARIAARRGAVRSARTFYSRQARTDAAIRTIPGLQNFGK